MFILNLKQYKVYIGELGRAMSELAPATRYTKTAVLVDANTRALCLPYFLQNTDLEPLVIEVPAGEQHKNLDTCRLVWGAMMAHGFDRKSLLVNLGGGVAGDMGGFCAATYLRGIDFLQVPTTLLSQVDASVGGKLAIDFNFVKNSIGVFQNPKAVCVDPVFLATLPQAELRSGFAEMIKHALIADASQWAGFQRIDSLQEVDWPALLPPSLSIKQRIVEEDPTEKGIRKALNFGHTIGHAVESFCLAAAESPGSRQRALLHGEAVAIGILCESWLSHQQAGLPLADLSAIVAFVQRFYPHQALAQSDTSALIDWMRMDKKNEGGRINFTLLPAIGQVRIDQYCDVGLIEEAMAFYRGLGG